MNTACKLLSWTLALTCVSALATEKQIDGAKVASPSQAVTSPRVDNTSVNERDKGGTTRTPQDQTNQVQDRELLAAVRRVIVDDKSLSTMAHNIKILVEGGVVTLRGPVQNTAEKNKVGTLAKQVKGITSADNQLDVKATASAQ